VDISKSKARKAIPMACIIQHLFCNYSWLGIVNLFQTFADLESVNNKQADTQAVRQTLDEDEAENGTEARSC